jgi:hypothetical protein
MDTTALSAQEARSISELLKTWPNRMGCVLVPAPPGSRYKNGWQPLAWGYKGRFRGSFDYDYLEDLLKDHPDAKLCPVTWLGLKRGAKNLHEHTIAFRLLITAIHSPFRTEYSYEKMQEIYNVLLKTNAQKLANLFDTYAERSAE